MKLSVIALIDEKDGWGPTITSVIEQTYENLELLLINIGMSVSNRELIREFVNTDSRVKACECSHEETASELPNIMRLAIEGQYIMKISNGMILEQTAVERIMHMFQRRKNEVFIYADVLPVNQNNEVLTEILKLNDEMENFYLYNPLRICFVCKKEVYVKVGGFNRSGLFGAAYDFCIRVQEEGVPVYHFRAKICQFRVGKDLSEIKAPDDIVNLRISKFKEEIEQCEILDVKRKVLNELIKQCRKYKSNNKTLRLMLSLIALQNPVNQNRLKMQKIKNRSRAVFDILDEPRKCYRPAMKMIRKYARKDLKLLDIGCGPGIMLQMVLDTFPDAMRVDGIDLSREMVRQAKGRLLDERAVVVEGTIDTVDFSEDFYDIELCMHSFHHYPRPLKSLRCMSRALRRKGVLIIVDNYYKGLKRLEQNFDLYVNEYCYGDMWMYSAWELVILTSMAGFYKQQCYKVGDKSFMFICQKR